jgi:Putative peptidoglycan binding domain
MDREMDHGDVTPARSPFRRRAVFAVVTLLAAAVALAIVLETRSTPPRNAKNASSAAGVATVQRRNLVETDTESGTLSYAEPQTVYDRLTGTITSLPRVGQVVKRGQALFEVDDKPVILLYGSKPAYRELDSADKSGPDVGELNANLVSLGYYTYGIVVDDTWQTATTAAVKALQRALGEQETGKLTLGAVVFLPGEQLVNTVQATTGSPVSFEHADSPRAELVDLTSTASATSTTTTTPTATSTNPTSANPTITQTVTVTRSTTPASHSDKSSGSSASGSRGGGAKPGGGSAGSGGAKSGGAGSGGAGSGGAKSGGAGSGGAAPGGTAILQTSSTRLVATVNLAAGSQSEAVLGSRVTVEMPDGSVVGGTIMAVSPLASSPGSNGGGSGGSSSSAGGGSPSSDSSGSPATVPVTIALNGHVKGAGLDQAAVSVNFAQAKAQHVLCVPVTALVATAGDAYAVQEVAAPHTLLPVSTGLFAGGYVQISGQGIHPGLQVTDSQG